MRGVARINSHKKGSVEGNRLTKKVYHYKVFGENKEASYQFDC